MLEEFHGNGGEGGVWIYKLYYGWNTLSTNVWLPSMSELVGTSGTQHATYGTYYSAMQDVPNASQEYNIDKNGGNQWAWLVPFNLSGGAAEIWRLCGNTTAWLRSPDKGQLQHVWAVISDTTISWAQLATLTHAVHPAMSSFHLSAKACAVIGVYHSSSRSEA